MKGQTPNRIPVDSTSSPFIPALQDVAPQQPFPQNVLPYWNSVGYYPKFAPTFESMVAIDLMRFQESNSY